MNKELTVLELIEHVANKQLDMKYLYQIKQLPVKDQFNALNELDEYINSVAWIDENGDWYGDVEKFDKLQEVYQRLAEIVMT